VLTHRWPRCARGPLLQGPRHGSGAPDRERSWGLAIQQPEKAQRFPRRAGATELQNKPGHRGQARGSRGQGARIAMRAAYSVGVVFIGGPSSCLALFAAASVSAPKGAPCSGLLGGAPLLRGQPGRAPGRPAPRVLSAATPNVAGSILFLVVVIPFFSGRNVRSHAPLQALAPTRRKTLAPLLTETLLSVAPWNSISKL
jgi:hypothetical protein